MRNKTEVFSLEHLDRLKRELAGQTYVIAQTSHSIRVQFGDRKFLITDNCLSVRALGLMLSLRKEVRARLNDLPLASKRARYYGWREREIVAGTQGFEYDLDAAYLNELFKLGGCSPALAAKIFSLPKKERLAVVGSLATLRITQTVVNGVPVGEPIRERDAALFQVWNTVVYNVDQRMAAYFNAFQQVLWYWVDALFASMPCTVPESKEKRFEIVAKCGSQLRLLDGRVFQIPIERVVA